jgi:hypothetical protein
VLKSALFSGLTALKSRPQFEQILSSGVTGFPHLGQYILITPII